LGSLEGLSTAAYKNLRKKESEPNYTDTHVVYSATQDLNLINSALTSFIL